MKNLKKPGSRHKEPLTQEEGLTSSSSFSLGSSLRPTPFPKRTCVKPQKSIKGMKSVRPRSKFFIKEE